MFRERVSVPTAGDRTLNLFWNNKNEHKSVSQQKKSRNKLGLTSIVKRSPLSHRFNTITGVIFEDRIKVLTGDAPIAMEWFINILGVSVLRFSNL